jgi:TonB-linked SusC/RagA family outer membrane protein
MRKCQKNRHFRKTLMTMKLSVILFVVSVTQIMATETYAQFTKLTMQLQDVKVKDVLKEIEHKSEFFFLYNSKLVDVERKLSIEARDEKIDEILSDLFRQTDVVYTVIDKQIVLTNKNDLTGFNVPEDQQTGKTISGKVTDVSGNSLPGVSVIVKGTTKGVLSDLSGSYSLSDVTGNPVLQFSFVGMKTQEITVGAQNSIDVILAEEAIGLEEVVVVGYGTQKKVNLTGSVASVNSRILGKTASTVASVSNALGGRLPGLITRQNSGSPGRDASTLSIRGFGAALIIVDGVESAFDNIDVNDIESISVLKDASAAIYGARSGNGVVLVTTKRGKEGKPTIVLNSTYSLQSITNYPKLLTSYQYATLQNEQNAHMGLTPRWTQEEIDKFSSGTDPDYPSTDWYNELIRPFSPMQNHGLSINGGSDRIKYYGNFGYLNQETVWKKNGGGFSRFNIRANIDAKITDNLSMQINFSNINEYKKMPARGEVQVWHDLYSSLPYYAATLPDPTKLVASADGGLGGPKNSSNMETLGFNYNDGHNIQVSGGLKYDIPFIKGLYAKVFVSYNQTYSMTKVMNKPGVFYTYSYATQTYTQRGSWSPEADLTHTDSKSRNITNQFSLNYDKIIAANHAISVLALYESIDYSDDYIVAARYHYLTPSIEYLFGGGTKDQYAFGSATEMGRKSYIGKLNYSFKNKYLLEVTVRNDASAKFPPDKRWGFFPSISGGWRISEESFFRDNTGSQFDNLKIRGGISSTGYDNVGNFAYLSGYQFGGKYIFGTSLMDGLVTKGLANPNLTWEKMHTYNLGLDFSLKQSILYGEFDVFYRKREGIPATRITSLPFTFGASLPPENLNSLNDRGFETLIGTRGVRGDFSWDISGNISWSRSKWDHFEEPDYSADPDKQRIYQNSGKWTDRVYGFKTDGLYKSQAEIDAMTFIQDGAGNSTIKPGDIKYINLNPDGVLDWRDMTDLGKGPMPHMMLGISANLEYNNFDFSVLFQGAGGNNINVVLSNTYEVAFLNRWTDANPDPNALYPRTGSVAQGGAAAYQNQGNGQGMSDFFLNKAGYIRLKSLNFGYTLPKNLVNFGKSNDNRLRIYFAGTNLFTIDKLRKFQLDPEAVTYGIAGNDGRNQIYYPQQRVITFGITLTM